MEASGVFGTVAAIAAFAGGALCAQAVLRRTRRRRAGEGGIGRHLARNGVRCADGAARRLLSVPKVAALAGDAQAALQGHGVVCTPRSLCSLAVAAAAALAVRPQHPAPAQTTPVSTTAPVRCWSPGKDAGLTGYPAAAPPTAAPAYGRPAVLPYHRAPATLTHCGCTPPPPAAAAQSECSCRRCR